jgi:hypothetical protein
MKTLSRPAAPPPFIDSFVAIRDSRQDRPNSPRARLTAHHRAITTRYDALEQAVTERTLEAMTASAYLDSLSDDFELTYKGQTKALRDLKSEIKAV